MSLRNPLTWMAAFLIGVAGIVIFLGPDGDGNESAGEHFLVTLAGANSDVPAIAIAHADSVEPQILTSALWSASSPSPAFDGTKFLLVGRRAEGDRDSIWEMKMNGTGLRLITAGHGAPASPTYLPDGRIVYTDVPAGVGADSAFPRAIYACAADGSAPQRLTFGGHRDERPRVLADGRVIFNRVFSTMPFAYDSKLMTIHPDGAGVAPFHGVAVLPAAAEALPSAWSGSERIRDWVRIAPHPRPPVLTSVVDAKLTTGTLLCLDVYRSGIPELQGLPRGSITEVRVSVLAAGAAAATSVHTDTVIGSVPVLEDGSFQVIVPADVPLGLALVRQDGTAAAVLRSGIWVRPNESRGCIGCHEDLDLAAENRVPLAVTRPVTRLAWQSVADPSPTPEKKP